MRQIEDDEESEDYDDADSDYSENSDYDSHEAENTSENFQSTSKMRGILTSVVSKISGSVGNLAKKDLMQNLKQNLGSQINLRASSSNLSKL